MCTCTFSHAPVLQDKGTTAEDVAANMDVAWARYYLSRLDMSAARGTPTDAASPLPECVQFPGLDLPPEASLPWGAEAVATTFDDMRALFSLCMPRIRAALAYYKLDGAVSDHVQLLFDGALAYRCARLHLSVLQCGVWNETISLAYARLHMLQC